MIRGGSVGGGVGVSGVVGLFAHAEVRNAAKIESLQWEFLDRAQATARTMLQIEGLPSTDATAAIELMAVVH